VGHYRTPVELHGRFHGPITDPTLNVLHLGNLGNCHCRLGYSMDKTVRLWDLTRPADS
jgi:hypothetical protein